MKERHRLFFLCLFLAGLSLLCTGCADGPVSAEKEERSETQEIQKPEKTEAAKETEEAGETQAGDMQAAGVGYDDYREAGGELALIFDADSVEDHGYNQSIYEGAETYARSAGVSYSYYSADVDTQEAYEKAIRTAVKNDAKLVVCTGSCFGQALGRLQGEYEEISFLLLDGVPEDASGNAVPIGSNVHCITYHEEEAGYLAGYMTVLDGYEKLGFIGGRQVPSVVRYGYGYVQGIRDAADCLGKTDDVSVDYWYADTFLPDEEIEKVSLTWYEDGTQVIFACGGLLYQSVLASAEMCGGRLIGVDVDQSGISELFLTSAVKGVSASVVVALDDFYANGGSWPEELAGRNVSYGANRKCIELPFSDEAWRFEHVSIGDYFELLGRLKSGEVDVSDETDSPPETTVSVTYHN